MENQGKQFKRGKKRRSFMQITKKHAKRGNFGHGMHIDQESFDYYCRIIELTNRNAFENNEDKMIYANNVLEESIAKAVELSCNQVVSRAFEAVLPFADCDHQEKFANAFLQNLRLACVDRFCSHVTQLMVLQSSERVMAGKQPVEESFVLKCSQFVVNNIEEFSSHVYACHVLRSCLDAIRNLNLKMPAHLNTQAYKALIESSLFIDLSQHELGSGVLQHLIRCLSVCSPKLCKKAVELLTEQVFTPRSSPYCNNDKPCLKDDTLDSGDDKNQLTEEKDTLSKQVASTDLPYVFETAPCARLLETAIECSAGKTYTQIYANIFINRFHLIAVHEIGNFSLQKLIKCCKDASEFDGIFVEASNCVEAALQCGHTGVIVALAEACKTLGTHQGDFLNCLMKALICFDPVEKQIDLCPKAAKLSSNKNSNPNDVVTLHGSLTLQAILHFKKPIKVVRSLLSMGPSSLSKLFSNPRGSHIGDAFFSAPFVGEKNKDKLIITLKDQLVEITMNKNGSRLVDAAWKSVGEKAQMVIADSLAGSSGKLSSTAWGRNVSLRINLPLYRSDRGAWVKSTARTQQHKRLLGPLTADDV